MQGSGLNIHQNLPEWSSKRPGNKLLGVINKNDVMKTRVYDLIWLNSFCYGVDKKANIKEGDKYIALDTNVIWTSTINGKNDERYLVILMSSNPSLGLPLLPSIEEDIEKLAKNYSEEEWSYSDFQGKNKGIDDEHTGQALRGAAVGGFERGYRAAKAKFQDRLPIKVEAEVIDNQVIVNKWIY